MLRREFVKLMGAVLVTPALVELHEGDDVPKMMNTAFDENKEYGAYGALGMNVERYETDDAYRSMFRGCTVACDEPYNAKSVERLKEWFTEQVCMVIPDSHHKWVEWITKPPNESGWCGCEVGTVGWKYRKKE